MIESTRKLFQQYPYSYVLTLPNSPGCLSHTFLPDLLIHIGIFFQRKEASKCVINPRGRKLAHSLILIYLDSQAIKGVIFQDSYRNLNDYKSFLSPIGNREIFLFRIIQDIQASVYRLLFCWFFPFYQIVYKGIKLCIVL